MPLLHGRPVCIEHAAPVVGLGSTCRVLPDHNPPDEVVAALHIVPVRWGEQTETPVKAKASLGHPDLWPWKAKCPANVPSRSTPDRVGEVESQNGLGWKRP